MPWYRGSSDLSGEYGDLFYGTTLRSKNVYVKSGGSTATRRGLERAFDAQYEGAAQVSTRRFGSDRYVLLGDGGGITALTSLPSSKYPGLGVGHSGFAKDYFGRADTATLASTGRFWEEGRNSDEVAAWTASDNTAIVSNEARFAQGTAARGNLDWTPEAPTSFYFSQWQLNLDALTLSSVGDNTDIFFFMGLPRERISSSTGLVLRERLFAEDAWRTYTNGGESVCWSGIACRVRVEKQAGSDNFRLQVSLGEFLGNKPSGDTTSNISGRIDTLAEKWTTSLFTEAQMQGKWLLSFGREREGADNYRIRASLWRNQGIFAYDQGNLDRTTADADVKRGSRRVDQGGGYSGFYRTMPSPGHAGAVCQFNDGTGTVGVTAVDISLEDNA
jgi:hypothetical protein